MAKYCCKTRIFAEIIEDELSSDEANDREIFWIKKFRDDGCQLANITNGGAGTSGWKRSKEECEKISKSLTGKKWDENRRNKWRGNQNGLGAKQSDRVKQIVSDTHKNKPKSLEHRKKLSEALKGRKLTEEQIDQRRQEMKRRWALKKMAKVETNI